MQPDLWSLPWYANSDDLDATSTNSTNSTDVFGGPPRNLLSASSGAAFCPPPPPPPCTTRSHPPPPPCTATGPPSTASRASQAAPTGHAQAAVFRPGGHHIAPAIVPSAVNGPPKLTDHGVTSEVLNEIAHPNRGAPARAKPNMLPNSKAVVHSVGTGGVTPHRRTQGGMHGHEPGVRGVPEGRTSMQRRLETDQGLMYFSVV